MRIAALCLSLVVLAVPAIAQPNVFGASSASRVAMTAEQGVYLDAIHGFQDEPRLLTADIDVLDAGGEVTFNLADGVTMTMAPERIERFKKGQFSWFGTIESGGRILGQAVVSVKDGLMMGEFATEDGMYALKPLGGGLHAMVKSEEEMPFESEELASRLSTFQIDPPLLIDTDAQATQRAASGAPVYRVLFPYTAPALVVVPDIALVAQQSIAYANQAYVNSQVNLRAEFAGLFELDMEESGSLETDLRRLQRTADGFGDAVHAERTRLGADVVTLFRTADTTSTAGIAFVCTGATSAFGVFEIDGTGTGVVFTHEVGHIIGGGHEDTAAAGCDSFSRAKEHPNEVWRSIMFSSFSSQTTIPYFSNPNVSVVGVTTGDANARDNARTFNARASTVANFQTDLGAVAVVVPQPASPVVQVVPGTTETVTLDLQNSGAGELTWWGITSSSPAFTFHTLGELVLGDLDTSGRILTPEIGSCGSGTDLTEGFATFDFGFDFPFGGNVYTQARVSSNGYVVFDGYDGCSSPVPGRIPASGATDAYVSAFWSPDVRPVRASSGKETRVIVKTLDDGRVTVKWIDAGFFIPSIPGSFFFVSAQAIFGPDGGVEFRYDDLFRVLVGNTGFTLSDGTEISPPLTTNIRVGVEYAANDGASVPFPRLQSAGQVFFPNSALELLGSSQSILPGQTRSVPVQINADRLPLGDYTLPLLLITNAPNAPALEIPIRVQVVTVIANEDDPDAVLAFRAIQPNPTADQATLAFDLATVSTLEVAVFDALGREVRRVDLGVQLGGAGETTLDTSGLASGVYLVRLEADGEVRTRRVTVVR